jgi:hypothetical protein
MRRGENSRQRSMLTFWNHDIKVAGKAGIAYVSRGFGLCSPPELEEAIFLTAGAMVIDAIRCFDGRMQFPGPRFLDPPTSPQCVVKRV